MFLGSGIIIQQIYLPVTEFSVTGKKTPVRGRKPVVSLQNREV
jgi:hypothetical protein